jgi:hypothetical protein
VISEEDVLTCCDFVAQGDVIEEKFVVRGGDFSSEFGLDIISIFEEFFLAVGESEADGFRGFPPRG